MKEKAKERVYNPAKAWDPNIFEYLLSDFTLGGPSCWYSASLPSIPPPTWDSLSDIPQSLFLLTVLNQESILQKLGSPGYTRDLTKTSQS